MFGPFESAAVAGPAGPAAGIGAAAPGVIGLGAAPAGVRGDGAAGVVPLPPPGKDHPGLPVGTTGPDGDGGGPGGGGGTHGGGGPPCMETEPPVERRNPNARLETKCAYAMTTAVCRGRGPEYRGTAGRAHGILTSLTRAARCARGARARARGRPRR